MTGRGSERSRSSAPLGAALPVRTDDPRIVYVVRSWPRWSQGFVLDEVLNLEDLGLDVSLCALTDPHEELVQPAAGRVRAPVRYLDQRGRRRAVADHLAAVRRSPSGYARAAGLVARRRDWDRGYRVATRWQCFGYAVAVARVVAGCAGERRDGATVHLHAHFAHDPAAVAHLTHLLTGVPWSFTAHARDLYQVPPSVLAERAASAAAVVTCCAANVEHLHAVLPPRLAERVRLVRHGVDSRRFLPARGAPTERACPVIASAGRLVEKKGFADVLGACRLLVDGGHRFTCVLYGDGPLRAALESEIRRLGLGEAVVLAGAVPREQLLERLQAADVFVITPHVTDDGDRDGIPNVLLEAMACGLPVVATAVAGIPEVVVDGSNGVLVPPHDVDAIAAGLDALLRDRDARRRLGAAAREHVVAHFDSRQAAHTLRALFAEPAGAPPLAPARTPSAPVPVARASATQADG